jgi:hypothetical protein
MRHTFHELSVFDRFIVNIIFIMHQSQHSSFLDFFFFFKLYYIYINN